MASAIQVLEDSHRNYIIKTVGTGAEAATLIVDVSALGIPCSAVKLWEVTYDVGVSTVATLLWDATADVSILTMTEGPGQSVSFADIGGLTNNSGAGKTGDVLLTVTGTGTVSLVLWFVKKNLTGSF